MILTCYLAIYAVGQFANGFLSDRFGPRLVVGLGLTVAVTTKVFMGFAASSLTLFVILYLADGYAQSNFAILLQRGSGNDRIYAKFLGDFADRLVSATIPSRRIKGFDGQRRIFRGLRREGIRYALGELPLAFTLRRILKGKIRQRPARFSTKNG